MPADPDKTRNPDRVPVQNSPSFHAAPVDLSSVYARTDGTATTLVLTLMRRRLEMTHLESPESSGAAGDEVTGRLQSHECVSKEFEAIIEPHHALRVAANILETLSNLPEEQRVRYGLEEDAEAEPSTTPDASDA